MDEQEWESSRFRVAPGTRCGADAPSEPFGRGEIAGSLALGAWAGHREAAHSTVVPPAEECWDGLAI
jgi:hypothetical protein